MSDDVGGEEEVGEHRVLALDLGERAVRRRALNVPAQLLSKRLPVVRQAPASFLAGVMRSLWAATSVDALRNMVSILVKVTSHSGAEFGQRSIIFPRGSRH